MSYIVTSIKCTKCDWVGTSSFGIVGMTQIGSQVSKCPMCKADIEPWAQQEEIKVMRDPKRIKYIISLIERIWKKNPDLRLCQLIGNAYHEDEGVFYLEDNELEKLLRVTYKKELE